MRIRSARMAAGAALAAVVVASLSVMGRDEPLVPPSREQLQKKAQTGDVAAMLQLGERALAAGDGLVDHPSAAYWFRQAAEKGNAPAMAYLGDLHAGGLGLPKDPALALEWYKKSANAGCPRAYACMGELYAAGKGVPRD